MFDNLIITSLSDWVLQMLVKLTSLCNIFVGELYSVFIDGEMSSDCERDGEKTLAYFINYILSK